MNANTEVKGSSPMKAQFWSFDVIFSIVIFSIAITILAFAWYNINNQLSLAYGSSAEIAQFQSQSLAQNLLSTGTPAGWNAAVNTTNTLTWANVSIGLGSSTSGSSLSSAKVYTFMAMTSNTVLYQATKQELGVGYDYYIIINGGGLNLTMGQNPLTNGALSIYIAKRSVTINGNPAVMTVEIWTNTALAIS